MSTMRFSLTSIAQLNNSIQPLFAQGAYGQAVSRLTVALRHIKAFVDHPSEPEKQDEDMQDSSTSPCFADCFQNVQEEEDEDACILTPVGREGTVLYARPWILAPPPPSHHHKQQDGCGCGWLDVVSYAVLHNLALATLLQALVTMDNNPKRTSAGLGKARLLYEHAYQIYCVATSRQQEQDHSHMLVVACNLGQIHYLLGNEREGNQCFQQILATVVLMNGSCTLERQEQEQHASSSSSSSKNNALIQQVFGLAIARLAGIRQAGLAPAA